MHPHIPSEIFEIEIDHHPLDEALERIDLGNIHTVDRDGNPAGMIEVDPLKSEPSLHQVASTIQRAWRKHKGEEKYLPVDLGIRELQEKTRNVQNYLRVRIPSRIRMAHEEIVKQYTAAITPYDVALGAIPAAKRLAGAALVSKNPREIAQALHVLKKIHLPEKTRSILI